MKRIALALLFTFSTGAAFAQGATTKQTPSAQAAEEKSIEERAKEITASMASHLRLTPEQTQKLHAVNLKSMVSAEEAKEKYKANPREAVKQMDIINQTRLSQIKDILSPMQFQQYQQRREEKMGVPKEAQSNPTRGQQSY
ncbi:hypothetical protein ACFSRY_15570 [Pontibacter locisalis]|uniref:LTXXQ motif family protein n=1 Tax=Pontibacter locisalis TaxID=1719035 RepID=A0ABW5INS8_9BACT